MSHRIEIIEHLDRLEKQEYNLRQLARAFRQVGNSEMSINLEDTAITLKEIRANIKSSIDKWSDNDYSINMKHNGIILRTALAIGGVLPVEAVFSED